LLYGALHHFICGISKMNFGAKEHQMLKSNLCSPLVEGLNTRGTTTK